MTYLEQQTPRQLVHIIQGSIAVTLSVFWLEYALFTTRQVQLWFLAAGALPLVAGGVLCWLAHRRLREGVLAELWSEPQLAEGYAATRNRFATVSIVILTGVYLALSAWYLAANRSHHFASPVILLPVMQWPALMTSSLTRLLKPYRAPVLPVDWASLPRLHSEHWGEPPARSL